LNDPRPTSAPSKKSHFGISWMGWNYPPQGSIDLVNNYFFLGLFSPDFSFVFLIYFFPRSLFFFLGLLLISFFLPPLTPIFFGNSYLPPPTYPSNLPKALPPTNPSTSLILLTPPLHSPPSPMLEKHEQRGHLGWRLSKLQELKSIKKGPTSKFEGGQFEAWEKAKLAKHEEPMSLEVSFLLPFF